MSIHSIIIATAISGLIIISVASMSVYKNVKAQRDAAVKEANELKELNQQWKVGYELQLEQTRNREELLTTKSEIKTTIVKLDSDWLDAPVDPGLRDIINDCYCQITNAGDTSVCRSECAGNENE